METLGRKTMWYYYWPDSAEYSGSPSHLSPYILQHRHYRHFKPLLQISRLPPSPPWLSTKSKALPPSIPPKQPHSRQFSLQRHIKSLPRHLPGQKNPKKARLSPDDSFEVFLLNKEHDPKELFNVSLATILRILYHQKKKRKPNWT